MWKSGMKQQRGVGLIEVLVTVLILATSLLAMGALQSRSLQFNHSAYLRSQANILAYDILDRMRINKDNFAGYERDFDDGAPGGSSLAARDVDAWLEEIARHLPGGAGAIDCEPDSVCTVSLRWIEQDDQAQEDGEVTTTFSYSTRF